MQTDAERIADALAGAYAQSPQAFTAAFTTALAQRVEIVHQPAQPQDGEYGRELVAAAQAKQAERIAGVLRNHRQIVTTAATGDEVTVTFAISGALPDGTAVVIDATDVLTVSAGQIVRLVSVFRCEQMDALLAAAIGG